jgi:hypothetical protein
LLQQYCGRKTILQWIVTDDETQMHNYELAHKCQNKKWKHASSPKTKEFKNVPSAGTQTLMLFWNFNEHHFQAYHNQGQMVNSACYCDMFEEQLKPTIHSKRRGRLTKTVILHYDNSLSHTAAATTEIKN